MVEIFLLVASFALLFRVGPCLDRTKWNSGKCAAHGRTWIYFDTDSQGGKGYKCEETWRTTEPDEHGHQQGLTCVTWISWSVANGEG